MGSLNYNNIFSKRDWKSIRQIDWKNWDRSDPLWIDKREINPAGIREAVGAFVSICQKTFICLRGSWGRYIEKRLPSKALQRMQGGQISTKERLPGQGVLNFTKVDRALLRLSRQRQTTLIGEMAKCPMAVPKIFIKMDPARLDLVTQLRGINPRRGVEITPLGAHKVMVFPTLWADNYPIPF